MAFFYWLTLLPADQPVVEAAGAFSTVPAWMTFGWTPTKGTEYFHLGGRNKTVHAHLMEAENPENCSFKAADWNKTRIQTVCWRECHQMQSQMTFLLWFGFLMIEVDIMRARFKLLDNNWISIKILEDTKQREKNGKSGDEMRVRLGGGVTTVIYLNMRLIIQTNSTFPDRERSRARPKQKGKPPWFITLPPLLSPSPSQANAGNNNDEADIPASPATAD